MSISASGYYEVTSVTVTPEDVAVATVGEHSVALYWQFVDDTGAETGGAYANITIIVIDCEDEYFDLTMTTQADQPVQTGDELELRAVLGNSLPSIIKSAILADPTNNYNSVCGYVNVEHYSATITTSIDSWGVANWVDNNLVDSVGFYVDTAKGAANLAEGTYAVSLIWSFSVTPLVTTTQTFNVVSVDC